MLLKLVEGQEGEEEVVVEEEEGIWVEDVGRGTRGRSFLALLVAVLKPPAASPHPIIHIFSSDLYIAADQCVCIYIYSSKNEALSTIKKLATANTEHEVMLNRGETREEGEEGFEQ